MRDHRSVLDILGLAAADQALYEALLARPQIVTTAELEQGAAGRPWEGETAAALHRLADRGLVARLDGEPARWLVIEPKRSLHGLILSGELALARAQYRTHQLAALFHRSGSDAGIDELVEVIYGQDACIRFFQELQSSVRGDMRSLTAPPFLDGPGHCGNPSADLVRQGGSYRVVYAESMAETPGWLGFLRGGQPYGEQARVGHVPVKLQIYDNEIALLPLHGSPGIGIACRIVLRHPTLIRVLNELFELCWERAVPVHVRDGSVSIDEPADSPTATESDLLRLLAAGLTDADIAAHLQWHIVTVRRHVRELMTKLGVSTRFQAGYQAVMRGWLVETPAADPAAIAAAR